MGLKKRFEEICSHVRKTEDTMRMLVGALGDKIPDPAYVGWSSLIWREPGGVGRENDVVEVQILNDNMHYRVEGSEETTIDHADPVEAAKHIKDLLRKHAADRKQLIDRRTP